MSIEVIGSIDKADKYHKLIKPILTRVSNGDIMVLGILFSGVELVGRFKSMTADQPRHHAAVSRLRELAQLQAEELQAHSPEMTFADVFQRESEEGQPEETVAIVATGSDAFCLKGFKKAVQQLAEHIRLETVEPSDQSLPLRSKTVSPDKGDTGLLADLLAKKEIALSEYREFFSYLVEQVLPASKS